MKETGKWLGVVGAGLLASIIIIAIIGVGGGTGLLAAYWTDEQTNQATGSPPSSSASTTWPSGVGVGQTTNWGIIRNTGGAGNLWFEGTFSLTGRGSVFVHLDPGESYNWYESCPGSGCGAADNTAYAGQACAITIEGDWATGGGTGLYADMTVYAKTYFDVPPTTTSPPTTTTSNPPPPGVNSAPVISNPSPASSINDYIGDSRTFSATTNQSDSDNKWTLNGVLQEWDYNTGATSYSNSSSSVGTWTIVLTSYNGTDPAYYSTYTWTWSVLEIGGTPTPTITTTSGGPGGPGGPQGTPTTILGLPVVTNSSTGEVENASGSTIILWSVFVLCWAFIGATLASITAKKHRLTVIWPAAAIGGLIASVALMLANAAGIDILFLQSAVANSGIEMIVVVRSAMMAAYGAISAIIIRVVLGRLR